MPEPKRVTDALFVTPQPGKPDIRRFAGQGFRTIINNRPDGEEPGQLSAADAKAEAQQANMAYVHLPVKTGAITASDVDASVARQSAARCRACKTGTRSYLLWGAAEVMSGKRDAGDIVTQAAASGYDLNSLPALVARLKESA